MSTAIINVEYILPLIPIDIEACRTRSHRPLIFIASLHRCFIGTHTVFTDRTKSFKHDRTMKIIENTVRMKIERDNVEKGKQGRRKTGGSHRRSLHTTRKLTT